MRILFWGTYDSGKPRLRILREGLLRAGIAADEIHRSPWAGIEDKSQVRGVIAKLCIGIRWFCAYPSLIWRLARTEKPDLILVSYPGLLDIFIAAAFGRMRRIPVAWNVFISLYDTIVEDRRLWSAESLRARMLYAVERFALRRPELLFMDTQAHARRIEELFSLAQGRCDSVWVGVEASRFAGSQTTREFDAAAPLHVLFYGQFIPLHGIPVIIEAARLLQDKPVQWTLIGRGQEESRIKKMLEAQAVPKLRWIEWVSYTDLKEHIAASDVCLGIFGTSAKSASVIPNKVFQIVASGRPLITRDSGAVRELLMHDPPCTQLIPAGSATALAEAVLVCARARQSLRAVDCHKDLLNRINETAVAGQFLSAIQRRLSSPKH